MQIWKKKTLNIAPILNSFSKSHCMVPTPIKLKENYFRVFYGSRNKNGISNIFYVDVLVKKNQIKILKRRSKPCFTKGKLGAFDDNGVLPSSAIKVGKKIFLYYIGWRPGGTTRFSLIAGLAISNNYGNNFKRYSKAPILKTNDKEPYSILTAPMVLKIKKNLYYMWYVSGITWKNSNLPNYNIKLAKSKDLKNWEQTGLACIKLKKGERAVARPFVIYEKKKFKMWYCYEKSSGNYKIGYATSINGKKWQRQDKLIKFKGSKSSYDKKMMCYPSILNLKNKKIMLYNGNNYGEKGFHFAEKIN